MHYVRTRTDTPGPRLLDMQMGRRRLGLSVLHATWMERRPPNQPAGPGHAHNVYHLVLYAQGRSRINLGGRAAPVAPGVVAMTAPGQMHDFGPHDRSALAYHELTFTLEDAAGPCHLPFHALLSYYTGLDVPPGGSLLRLDRPDAAELTRLFADLLAALGTGTPGGTARAHAVIAAMLTLLAVALQRGQDPPRASDDPLSAVAAHIERHFPQALRVNDLAELAGLSPGYLIRAFRTRFGRSPIAYQLALRMEAARSLLASSNLRCKEIATRVGFADVYGFSKAFRAKTGQSPRQYRSTARP